MRNFRQLLLTSTLLFGAGAIATPAYAQDGAPQPTTGPEQPGNAEPGQAQGQTNAQGEPVEEGAIVVTGSRIRRDEFSVAEPLTVISREEITQSGFNSVTDALQSGAVTQGAGQINNAYGGFVTDGGTGANTLGLRGLGPARTLILLNGRRLAPGGTRGSILAADLNVLPTAIVERIEILKAGASSIYGSDAIAGVVNIITDRTLTGLHLDMQTNVPQVGDGVDNRIAASFGVQTGGLSLIGSFEYRHRQALARNDVNFASCPIGGFLNGEGSEFGSGDPFPVGDPRNCFTIDNGGVTINTLGIPTRQGIGRTSGALGNFNRFVPAPGVGGPFPGFLGVGTYDRDTFDANQENEPLITGAEIYTGYVSAVYETGILGNAELYGEVLATRRKSESPLYRQLSLDYLQGSPLLPLNIRNGAFLGPTNTSSGQNIAARAFIGYGLTDSSQQVDYVRASVGLRGDFFFPGWRYDAYAGKSWNDGRNTNDSFLVDRLATSLDVVQNANGTFSCRAQASIPNCVAAPALTAAVIGGALSDAYRDYIVDPVTTITQFRETTFAFGLDGPLFTLPGGEVQLALGAEYRQQRINDQPDAQERSGNLFGLTAGLPTVGSDSVREVFAELFVPLLKDRPFFYRLNLDASVRYTDYESYGADTTYKISGEWEPFHGFGFRGSYGTSYRAPALAEQFLGATSGFLGAASDPCDADNFPRVNGNPNPAGYNPTQQQIAANCQAVGLNVATFQQNSGITVLRVGGAQAGLAAETSTNWSVGAVVRPQVAERLGSLALSLDYFNIKVDNGVSDLSGSAILSRCFSDRNFDASSGFCRFVQRDSNNVLTVTSSFVNLSQDNVKGFEFNARYSNRFFGGRIVLNANVTKYTEQSSRTFAEEFLTDANGIITQPDWVGNFDGTLTFGDVSFRYGLDWIDGDSDRTYEYFAFDNLTGVSLPEDVQFYRDNYSFITRDYFLHNASVQFSISDRYQFTFGVRNIFDTEPPQITAAGFSAIGNAPLYSGYDYRGRTFFANATFRF